MDELEYCDLVPQLELVQLELKALIPRVAMPERLRLNEIIRDVGKIKRKIEEY
jgi:hypothetical protein